MFHLLQRSPPPLPRGPVHGLSRRFANSLPRRSIDSQKIAGNFFSLLKDISAAASDLLFKGGVGSPSVLVRELSVAG
ncbi:MAG: hypothetical protein LBP80_04845 [Treponema sp.]|nr:hypothetical protein [Treponema sp.]